MNLIKGGKGMLKDKIKALILNQNEKNSKKKIENIVVFIVILIITVIAINSIWSGDKNKKEKNSNMYLCKSYNYSCTKLYIKKYSSQKKTRRILSHYRKRI